MMVVASLRLHFEALPYAQLSQPDALLVVVLFVELVVVSARRNLLLEELDFLSLSEVLPILFPWAT